MTPEEINSQQSVTDRFKNAESLEESEQILSTFLFDNKVIDDKTQCDKFVDINITVLTIECNTYGVSMDNPFFTFLNKYYVQNKRSIEAFFNTENYRVLHNVVADGIISTKQLAFTCAEGEQVRILVNPSLWAISAKDDIRWLIKTYVWFLEERLNSFVINVFVRSLFVAPEKIGDRGAFLHVNLDTKENRQTLLKCLLFTDFIQQVCDKRAQPGDNSDFVELQQRLSTIKNNSVMLVSSPLKPADLIEHQIKLLNELAQESPRNINGRQQQTDVAQNQKIDRESDNLSRQDARLANIKTKDILEFAKQQFNTTDISFVKALLKYIGEN